MAAEDRQEAEAPVRTANKAAAWVSWYFKRGAFTLATAPLFLFLCYCLAVAVGGSIFQGLALSRAAFAVFGFIGGFAIASLAWMPVVAPPVL